MLAETLRTILETSADANERARPSISLVREVWPTLVGKPICRRTEPLRWDGETLVVGVASDGWRAEMRRNHNRLLRRVRGRFPWPVDGLDFEVCDLPSAARERSEKGDDAGAPESAPSVEEVDGPLREELERLDPDMRDLALRITRHVERADRENSI